MEDIKLDRVKQVVAQFIAEYEKTGVLQEAKLAKALAQIYQV